MCHLSNRTIYKVLNHIFTYFLGPAQETSITDRRDGAEGDDRLFKEFEAVESLSESPIITYFDPPGKTTN